MRYSVAQHSPTRHVIFSSPARDLSPYDPNLCHAVENSTSSPDTSQPPPSDCNLMCPKHGKEGARDARPPCAENPLWRRTYLFHHLQIRSGAQLDGQVVWLCLWLYLWLWLWLCE